MSMLNVAIKATLRCTRHLQSAAAAFLSHDWGIKLGNKFAEPAGSSRVGKGLGGVCLGEATGDF